MRSAKFCPRGAITPCSHTGWEEAACVQPSWVGHEGYSGHQVKHKSTAHSVGEEGKSPTAVSRSREVTTPTLLGTCETALGAPEQPQFKMDVEKRVGLAEGFQDGQGP